MADNNLTLEILSPEGKTFDSYVKQISLQTRQGEITILPHHAPLYTKVAPGEIRIIEENNKSHTIAVTGGFLEIAQNMVRILADYAVRADEINIAKAEEAKKKAEKLLQERSENEDFLLIEKDLQRALLELKVADDVNKRNRG